MEPDATCGNVPSPCLDHQRQRRFIQIDHLHLSLRLPLSQRRHTCHCVCRTWSPAAARAMGFLGLRWLLMSVRSSSRSEIFMA